MSSSVLQRGLASNLDARLPVYERERERKKRDKAAGQNLRREVFSARIWPHHHASCLENRSNGCASGSCLSSPHRLTLYMCSHDVYGNLALLINRAGVYQYIEEPQKAKEGAEDNLRNAALLVVEMDFGVT